MATPSQRASASIHAAAANGFPILHFAFCILSFKELLSDTIRAP